MPSVLKADDGSSSARGPSIGVTPAPFAVTSHDLGNGVRLELGGELDVASGPELVEAVDREAPGRARLVLDLRSLDFIDCAGLRAILRIRARCILDHRDLALIQGPPIVQRLFELTGKTRRLPFVDAKTIAPYGHAA